MIYCFKPPARHQLDHPAFNEALGEIIYDLGCEGLPLSLVVPEDPDEYLRLYTQRERPEVGPYDISVEGRDATELWTALREVL